MLIRLGYVAMTLNLENASPSKTITYSSYEKIANIEGRQNRVIRIARENLENTRRILLYSAANDIKIYRFTSKLIPLATHGDVPYWDYAKELADEFKEIGDIVKENDMRVSAHPDHFIVINSPKKDVFEKAVLDLEYHNNIYEAMGLSDFKYKLVVHVGGLYSNKEKALEMFMEGFEKLPKYIKKRIIIENDDKSFNAKDVLKLCSSLGVPMVYDNHHNMCNPSSGENFEEMLNGIFKTWEGEYFPPKIHFSSPKDDKNIRSHADDINPNDFIEFLGKIKGVINNLDIMLEAKNKDNALFNLYNIIKRNDAFTAINPSKIFFE